MLRLIKYEVKSEFFLDPGVWRGRSSIKKSQFEFLRTKNIFQLFVNWFFFFNYYHTAYVLGGCFVVFLVHFYFLKVARPWCSLPSHPCGSKKEKFQNVRCYDTRSLPYWQNVPFLYKILWQNCPEACFLNSWSLARMT